MVSNIGLDETVGVSLRFEEILVYLVAVFPSNRSFDAFLLLCLRVCARTQLSNPFTTTGQYWGEMGFFRIVAGQNMLGIEEKVAWATPGYFTTHNVPCSEDGKHCGPVGEYYIDPSRQNVVEWEKRHKSQQVLSVE